MPNSVHLKFDRLGHVMTDQLKAGMAHPLRNIRLSPREVIVQTDHLFSGFHQAIAEMGAQKTGTSCEQIALYSSGT